MNEIFFIYFFFLFFFLLCFIFNLTFSIIFVDLNCGWLISAQSSWTYFTLLIEYVNCDELQKNNKNVTWEFRLKCLNFETKKNRIVPYIIARKLHH